MIEFGASFFQDFNSFRYSLSNTFDFKDATTKLYKSVGDVLLVSNLGFARSEKKVDSERCGSQLKAEYTNSNKYNQIKAIKISVLSLIDQNKFPLEIVEFCIQLQR